MAAIYEYETGGEISAGLQGCGVCDKAWETAVAIAGERGEPVVLEDDDGLWFVHPEGYREPAPRAED